jgi:DNA polymerase I-like protein with 3'-5' exonuclease and polymerase domains
MSYWDDHGLFWEAEVRPSRDLLARREDVIKRLRMLVAEREYVAPPMPPVPHGVEVAIDLETDDPDLMTRGPSWAYGRGEIIGVSIAFAGFAAYYPLGHRTGNVDPKPVFGWLADLFDVADNELIFAHANYDLGWLRQQLGRYPRGRTTDVQHEAVLLWEHRPSYSLDELGKIYLAKGKATDDLHRAELKLGVDHRMMMGMLKHAPAALVADYAVADAVLTLALHQHFKPLIAAEKLGPVAALEGGLIPLSVEMRRKGVRVDVARAEQLHHQIVNVSIKEITARIKHATGVAVEPWQTETIAAALRQVGIEPERTAKGAVSVTKPFLARCAASSDVAADINQLRQLSKMASTFLQGYIIDHHSAGRLHASFNQLRQEQDVEGGGYAGTITGRYSSSGPNLQNIPVRDDEWGPIMRSLFLADEGETLVSLDYSSQEPRLATHFAYKADVAGAAMARQAYLDNPRLDYHQFVADLCNIERKYAKTLNLALSYGMGSAKLARALGMPTRRSVPPGRQRDPTSGKWEGKGRIEGWIEVPDDYVGNVWHDGRRIVDVAGPQAMGIIRAWREKAPFLKGLFDAAEEKAFTRGHILTLLKRRCRFRKGNDGFHIFIHAAMNRLCQSSAADQTKTGMLELWRQGIAPSITVHDELVLSLVNPSDALDIARVMEQAIPLEVPVVVDVRHGANWGQMEKLT